MITISDKHNCCGCSACAQACPKQCISMLQDAEGFLYPQVDTSSCINCELCERVCPVLNQYDERTVETLCAAINKDDIIRKESSSGGVFTLLAEQIISKGGVVFGARFDDEWQVVIDSAETMEQVAAFRGSKYVQARVNDSFQRCRKYLDEGKNVLFSGTPCLISGLLHFLKKPYPNLVTVDFICHGVPSPEVWRRYLNEVIEAGSKAIRDINFRTKHDGWGKFSFFTNYIESSNTIEMLSPTYKNPFMRAFISNVILRPSCFSCPAKNGRSNSDLTIADFWNIDKVSPGMYDDKGTSLIIIHNDKGKKAIPFNQMMYEEEPVEALRYNPSYSVSPRIHHRRQEFFDSFLSDTNVHQLISYTLRPTFRQKISTLFWPYCKLKNLVKILLGRKVITQTKPNTGVVINSQTKKVFDSCACNLDQIVFRDKRNSWNSNYLRINITIDNNSQ